jgi:dual specificity tyrosine-phosphorylation-regulated kinase 1
VILYLVPLSKVLLGIKYTMAIDMWSLGCILVEMHTGEPLFNGSDEFDQMRKIVEILGMPPHSMLRQSPKLNNFFRAYHSTKPNVEPVYKLCRIKSSGEEEILDVYRSRSMEALVGVDSGGPQGRRRGEAGHEPHDYRLFVDLVYHMLQYDPERRIKPLEALSHPYFTERANAAGGMAADRGEGFSQSSAPSQPTVGSSAADNAAVMSSAKSSGSGEVPAL